MLCDHAALVALRHEASKALLFFISIAYILNKNYKSKHRRIGQMVVCPVIDYNKSILGILMKNSQASYDYFLRNSLSNDWMFSQKMFLKSNFLEGQKSSITWCNFPSPYLLVWLMQKIFLWDAGNQHKVSHCLFHIGETLQNSALFLFVVQVIISPIPFNIFPHKPGNITHWVSKVSIKQPQTKNR